MEHQDNHRLSNEWLHNLRREFVRIASRRVDDDDVEDVVQEAMRVIAEKRPEKHPEKHDDREVARDGGPLADAMPLAWCFQVLRNTIGNHYQRQRTRQRWTELDSGAIDRASAHPIESLVAQSTLAVVESALKDMSLNDTTCANYLSQLADGTKAGDIADDESIERAAFYRRLYRCRQKLRELLSARGVLV